MNVGVSVKRFWGSCEDDYIWNPSTCYCDCNKACKIVE